MRVTTDAQSLLSVMSRGRSLEKPDPFLRIKFRRVRAVGLHILITLRESAIPSHLSITQISRFFSFGATPPPNFLALVTQVLRAFTQNSDNLTRGAHESQGRAFKFLPGYRVIYAWPSRRQPNGQSRDRCCLTLSSVVCNPI